MEKLIGNLKKTIVFLGRLNKKNQPEPYATGFLVTVQNIYHLVTAKHVIQDSKSGKLKDDEMFAFYNLKEEGEIYARNIGEFRKQSKNEWIFHNNRKVDIAIIPFPLSPETDDVKVISDESFLSPDKLFELYDIFFLSFQPGVVVTKRLSPIFRTGTISRINDDKTFYVDAAAFPGNSGSPVFLKPSPIRFDEGGISVGPDKLGGKFIGIIGAYLPYKDVAISAQTGDVRVIFEENTGLSVVWSVSCIKTMLRSRRFLEQLENIKNKAKK